MATTAGPSSPSSPLPSTTSTLWAHLLHHRAPSRTNGTQIPTSAQLTPQDKASTSTRILLHDTHARLEKFSERANAIFSEVETSRREMVRVREEVEGAREKELDAIVQLGAFCFAHIYAYYCALTHNPLSQSVSVLSPESNWGSGASSRSRLNTGQSHTGPGAPERS
jgi:hypothetical protein